MDRKVSVEDILEKAEYQNITADELDILVAKTREISKAREKELETLKTLLQELESHLQH